MLTSRSTLAIVALALVVVGSVSGCAPTQRAGVRHIEYPVTSCPASRSVPETTTDPGGASTLVPFAPRAAMLCLYRWHGGVQSATQVLARSLVLSAAQAAKLAHELDGDAHPTPQDAASCPQDAGCVLDAYFWTSHEHIEVAANTSGCTYADNGWQTQVWIGDSNFRNQLEGLLGTVG